MIRDFHKITDTNDDIDDWRLKELKDNIDPNSVYNLFLKNKKSNNGLKICLLCCFPCYNKQQISVCHKCCSKKTDYIHSGLPLKQATYRTMLAKGNRPSTAKQISDFLVARWGESVYTRSLTPAVISRLLETSMDYEISVK